jgi:uncharacterized membrane protein
MTLDLEGLLGRALEPEVRRELQEIARHADGETGELIRRRLEETQRAYSLRQNAWINQQVEGPPPDEDA